VIVRLFVGSFVLSMICLLACLLACLCAYSTFSTLSMLSTLLRYIASLFYIFCTPTHFVNAIPSFVTFPSMLILLAPCHFSSHYVFFSLRFLLNTFHNTFSSQYFFFSSNPLLLLQLLKVCLPKVSQVWRLLNA